MVAMHENRVYSIEELKRLDAPEGSFPDENNVRAGWLLGRWLDSPASDGLAANRAHLAALLNVSPSAVSRYIEGNRRPRPHTVQRLRSLTGLFFHGWETMPPVSSPDGSPGRRRRIHLFLPERAAVEVLSALRAPIGTIAETVVVQRAAVEAAAEGLDDRTRDETRPQGPSPDSLSVAPANGGRCGICGRASPDGGVRGRCLDCADRDSARHAGQAEALAVAP